MVTVQTRARQVAQIEGFDVTVTRNGKAIEPSENGILGSYPFDRKLTGSKTVADWKRDRFEKTYHGYSCRVHYENGTEAPGQTLLSTVRSTYEED